MKKNVSAVYDKNWNKMLFELIEKHRLLTTRWPGIQSSCL